MGFSLSGFGDFVSSIGSNAVNAVTNGYFNRKAASKQYDYSTSLRDYENEYNLPINQRARLEEAGYNPNLALNGVNVQSVTASAPQVKPTQIDLLQAYNLEAQNELLKEQQKLTHENMYRAMTENLLTGRKANLLYYQDKYAEQEFNTFKKTGKIPESYYKNMNAIGSISKFFDQLSQYITN